jgi:hypothetical protein
LSIKNSFIHVDIKKCQFNQEYFCDHKRPTNKIPFLPMNDKHNYLLVYATQKYHFNVYINRTDFL